MSRQGEHSRAPGAAFRKLNKFCSETEQILLRKSIIAQTLADLGELTRPERRKLDRRAVDGGCPTVGGAGGEPGETQAGSPRPQPQPGWPPCCFKTYPGFCCNRVV